MHKVSIIIVNFNVTELLISCLRTLYRNLSNLRLQIIVVDNNSTDKTINDITTIFSQVKFIQLDENVGYAKANMIGVKYSIYENLLFLNPDTEIISDFITPILEFINSDSSVGACGPKLVSDGDRFQYSFGENMNVFNEILEAFMLINIYRCFKKTIYKERFENWKPFRVGWISGACLVIKKNLFLSVGGFNSNFFLNYEDIDLCTNINAKGFNNYYFPYLKCIHKNQMSQKMDYSQLTYTRYVSRLIFAQNHYRIIISCFIRIIHIIGLILRLLFVNLFYSNVERVQRYMGYKKSLFLYLGLIKF